MARYIARTCPRCRDYFGVAVSQEPHTDGDYPITAHCAVCGFQLKGWRLISGHKQSLTIYSNREAQGDPMNARWLCRQCPKCRGVLAVIVRSPDESPPLQAVNGRCIRCGYRLVWAVIWAEKKRTRAPWLVQWLPRIVSVSRQAEIPPA